MHGWARSAPSRDYNYYGTTGARDVIDDAPRARATFSGLTRMKMGSGIVVLVDMDCFYVQVEQELVPETRNLPCAVVQYNNTARGGR